MQKPCKCSKFVVPPWNTASLCLSGPKTQLLGSETHLLAQNSPEWTEWSKRPPPDKVNGIERNSAKMPPLSREICEQNLHNFPRKIWVLVHFLTKAFVNFGA